MLQTQSGGYTSHIRREREKKEEGQGMCSSGFAPWGRLRRPTPPAYFGSRLPAVRLPCDRGSGMASSSAAFARGSPINSTATKSPPGRGKNFVAFSPIAFTSSATPKGKGEMKATTTPDPLCAFLAQAAANRIFSIISLTAIDKLQQNQDPDRPCQ